MPASLERQDGRIRIALEAAWQGRALRAALHGGEAHIGAVALARPGQAAQELSLPGHREGPIAKSCAARLAAALGCPVALAAGIHYNAITKAEIARVERLALELADDLIALLKSGGPMLTLNDLEQFEKRLKSGELEEQFKCAPEGIRLEILEMLEKIMDVADLADEVATRLIFRSQAGAGRQAH